MSVIGTVAERHLRNLPPTARHVTGLNSSRVVVEGARRICKFCKSGYEPHKNRCRKTLAKFTADCKARHGPGSHVLLWKVSGVSVKSAK